MHGRGKRAPRPRPTGRCGWRASLIGLDVPDSGPGWAAASARRAARRPRALVRHGHAPGEPGQSVRRPGAASVDSGNAPRVERTPWGEALGLLRAVRSSGPDRLEPAVPSDPAGPRRGLATSARCCCRAPDETSGRFAPLAKVRGRPVQVGAMRSPPRAPTVALLLLAGSAGSVAGQWADVRDLSASAAQVALGHAHPLIGSTSNVIFVHPGLLDRGAGFGALVGWDGEDGTHIATSAAGPWWGGGVGCGGEHLDRGPGRRAAPSRVSLSDSPARWREA